MPSKDPFLFRIGTLAVVFCAILNAQIVTSPKLPMPLIRHAATCLNCVRDLSGRISRNPAPVRAFRANKPCPATKSVTGPCPGYVVDFVKPLSRGGADTPQNMQWRTIAQATKGRGK
jgi:hypothetical protein